MVWTTSQRWISSAWPLAQQSAAAVVAWLVAVRVVGHEDRQNAAERAADLARWLVEHAGQVPAPSALAAAYAGIRMVAADVMVFAGVDPEHAFRAAPPSTRLDK